MVSGDDITTLEDAKEQVRKACKRLALLHLSYAKTLVSELGEVQGEQLVMKAIKDYGTKIGEAARAEVEEHGLPNGPANFRDDLPRYGMHQRPAESVEIDGEPRRRVYGCVMGQLWRDLGESELGRLYCYVDPAKFMAFDPAHKMVHTKAIPDGDDYCEFAIRPTTPRERADFASSDADWAYVDR